MQHSYSKLHTYLVIYFQWVTCWLIANLHTYNYVIHTCKFITSVFHIICTYVAKVLKFIYTINEKLVFIVTYRKTVAMALNLEKLT